MQTIDVSLLPETAVVRELGREPVYLERNGPPHGGVVSPELYRRWAQRRDRFSAVMDEVGARNPDKSEDEVEADIQQAIIDEARARRP